MSSLARGLVAEIVQDHDALAELAAMLLPYLAPPQAADDGWLDTRAAADYAGCSVDALKKAMARREIYFEQNAPGGKAWFRRAHIDAWRCGLPPVRKAA